MPPRLSFVTLGARDVARLRRFYEAWGWAASTDSSSAFASFELGTVSLALYDLELLRREAAPDHAAPDGDDWNGITLAVNVGSRSDVGEVFAAATAAGATIVHQPIDREWGGFSGYLADPEGNRWEIAWAP